ncbi:hypothetical protein PP501_gp30 [Gordonia phage Powerball]|uniref:Uncharacterized protein n=1 Tax=Gordonia phage Powerball TaxID=2599847 RepID=A0A5J6TRY3_9CAUD|nr:hypothetical protein PP501_gp30 [Gordonia phage Powerball]QFG13511.1 hypothetical protein PBI_POWERBALL_30 [Gordonia phage Powerball]
MGSPGGIECSAYRLRSRIQAWPGAPGAPRRPLMSVAAACSGVRGRSPGPRPAASPSRVSPDQTTRRRVARHPICLARP